MKTLFGLVILIILFITFTTGSIINGLIRYPMFSIEHYLTMEKILINFVVSVVFLSIFVFVTPVFKNLFLVKKLAFRLGIANFLASGLLPFLIGWLSPQEKNLAYLNFYNWIIFIACILILIAVAIMVKFERINTNK